MLSKRLFAIVAAVVLLIAAGFTIQTGTVPALAVPIQVKASDPALRLPSGELPLAGAEPSDYFQRHPELLRPGNTPDLSDYFQRHSGSTMAVANGASDWFQRHPEVRAVAQAVDLSDYYQRHPAVLTSGDSVGATDYFERHPDLLKPGNAVDLSDYYQRHASPSWAWDGGWRPGR